MLANRALAEALAILRRASWGQGFAVEAAKAVIAHAFEVLGERDLRAHDELYPRTGLQHPSYRLERPGSSDEGGNR